MWDFIKLCLLSDFFCSKTLNGFLGGVQFVKSIKSFHLALIVSIIFQTTFIWVWILIYLWQLYMNSCWIRLIYSFDKLGRYVTLNSFTIKFKNIYRYIFHCQLHERMIFTFLSWNFHEKLHTSMLKIGTYMNSSLMSLFCISYSLSTPYYT